MLRLLFTAIVIQSITTSVQGKCCLCGEMPTGQCYLPTAPSDRKVWITKNADGETFTCGLLHEYAMSGKFQAGPCGIAQATAFLDGEAGCGCPVDNRGVNKTPECSTCAADEIKDLYDEYGKVKWFLMGKIGALTCKELFNYALEGYIGKSLCSEAKQQLVINGCCGEIEVGRSGSTGAVPIPVPNPVPSPTPSPTPAPKISCVSDNECRPHGLHCDRRGSGPYFCNNHMIRAKQAKAKQLTRSGRGGSRWGGN